MRDFDELGWEWAAWYALQGDENLELVHRSATELQKQMGDVSARLHASGDIEGSKVVAAANLFLIAMSELLDSKGTSLFEASITYRKRGKPINKRKRANNGHKAAGIVDRLVGQGWKQEAALMKATDDTGLSRAEIMIWLSNDRRMLKMTPQEIADKFMPRSK